MVGWLARSGVGVVGRDRSGRGAAFGLGKPVADASLGVIGCAEAPLLPVGGRSAELFSVCGKAVAHSADPGVHALVSRRWWS